VRERILEGVRDDFVGEQTDQDDARGRQFDSLSLHAHHNRPHVAQQLSEIMAQIAESPDRNSRLARTDGHWTHLPWAFVDLLKPQNTQSRSG